MHLAVDSKTHEIICADLSLNNVTDSEAFPGLIRQTHRKIRAAYPCEVSIKATNNPTTSEIFEVNYPFLLTLQKMRESKVFFFLYFHLYVFFYML
uniref:Mobile element protein n=1 Tax=Klebsiella pneumoniae TaxID=573 RepID=A0A6G9HU14_KLEPN|nr:Mobile element protein [Klebsiella pneumoniae]